MTGWWPRPSKRSRPTSPEPWCMPRIWWTGSHCSGSFTSCTATRTPSTLTRRRRTHAGTALEVPLYELAAEVPVVAAVTEEPPGASGLRLVLSGAYALRAMLDGRRPAALSTLRTKSRKAWELAHAGQYTDLADLLRG